MPRDLEIQRSSLDDFVADLTDAAYPVALRHEKGEVWLDLELDLWKALEETVRKWGPRFDQVGSVPSTRPASARRPTATLSNVFSLGQHHVGRLYLSGE